METADSVRRLYLTITPVTEQAIFAPAGFKIRHAIPFADGFAAATIKDLDAILVTGGPALANLER